MSTSMNTTAKTLPISGRETLQRAVYYKQKEHTLAKEFAKLIKAHGLGPTLYAFFSMSPGGNFDVPLNGMGKSSQETFLAHFSPELPLNNQSLEDLWVEDPEMAEFEEEHETYAPRSVRDIVESYVMSSDLVTHYVGEWWMWSFERTDSLEGKCVIELTEGVRVTIPDWEAQEVIARKRAVIESQRSEWRTSKH